MLVSSVAAYTVHTRKLGQRQREAATAISFSAVNANKEIERLLTTDIKLFVLEPPAKSFSRVPSFVGPVFVISHSAGSL